uniref:Uncharacterized protein n=1 Tax=Anguilla anguilla TaxID=7936 RepID=A0A0E9SZN5_ANGAN
MPIYVWMGMTFLTRYFNYTKYRTIICPRPFEIFNEKDGTYATRDRVRVWASVRLWVK